MNFSKYGQILLYFWNKGIYTLLLDDNTVDALRVYSFNRLSGVYRNVLTGSIEESEK